MWIRFYAKDADYLQNRRDANTQRGEQALSQEVNFLLVRGNQSVVGWMPVSIHVIIPFNNHDNSCGRGYFFIYRWKTLDHIRHLRSLSRHTENAIHIHVIQEPAFIPFWVRDQGPDKNRTFQKTRNNWVFISRHSEKIIQFYCFSIACQCLN